MIASKHDLSLWLGGQVTPLLQEHGFSRSKLVYLRALGDLTDVIEFVFERPGRHRGAMFTIELGFFHEGIHRALWPKSTRRAPSTVDCAVSLRVGRLLPDSSGKFRDKWWALATEEDGIAAEKEVLAILTSHVLPFLTANHSLQAMRFIAERMFPSLLPAEKLALSLLCVLLGDRGAGIQIIDQFLSNPPSAWTERAVVLREGLAPGNQWLDHLL